MKKYLVLATLFILSSAAQAANITWHGATDIRYGKTSLQDNLAGVDAAGNSTSDLTTKTWDFMANLGASGGWDNIEWGTNFRLSGGVPNGAWVNFGATGGNEDFALGVGEAWFRYSNDWGFGDMSLTVGRQTAAFSSGADQTFLDHDVRFDGLGWNWKWGSFGFNMSQYILGAESLGVNSTVNGWRNTKNVGSTYAATPSSEAGATTQGGFTVMYSFQPHFHWRFTDEIDMNLAIGYHKLANATGTNFQNAIPNSGGLGGFTTAGLVSEENSRWWVVQMDLGLPYMMGFNFEYVKNKDQRYGTPNTQATANPSNVDVVTLQDATAWSAGLTFGNLKKAQDFWFGYTYTTKGLGSVVNRMTYDKIPGGFKGHTLAAAYNLSTNFHLKFRLILLEEKDPKNFAGVALTTTEKLDRNYWDVSMGVKF